MVSVGLSRVLIFYTTDFSAELGMVLPFLRHVVSWHKQDADLPSLAKQTEMVLLWFLRTVLSEAPTKELIFHDPT